jgi:hypothetical protein
MPSELARACDAGADAVLSKPVTPETLLNEVERLLRQPPGRRPSALRPSQGSPTGAGARRVTAQKAHLREMTASPPVPPRALVCQSCDRPLTYQHSYFGGVSAKYSEQWDRYACRRACGTFEYRVRTHELRSLLAESATSTKPLLFT